MTEDGLRRGLKKEACPIYIILLIMMLQWIINKRPVGSLISLVNSDTIRLSGQMMVPDLNADVQRPVVQYSNGGKGFIGCFHHNVAKKRARSHHSMPKLHCIIPVVDTVDIVDIVFCKRQFHHASK